MKRIAMAALYSDRQELQNQFVSLRYGKSEMLRFGHSRVRGNPGFKCTDLTWMPAFRGMTDFAPLFLWVVKH
jgi:hypothetical protein